MDYEQFLEAIDKIAKKAEEWQVDSVWGIPRGGLVPAVYLSHRLDVPVDAFLSGDRCLLVDDISDSGKTLEAESANYYYKTATIFFCRESCFEPDFWVYEKNDDWVIFPWENRNAEER